MSELSVAHLAPVGILALLRAGLFRHGLALLVGHVAAVLAWHAHAVLPREVLALVARHAGAHAARHVAALLVGHLVALLSRHTPGKSANFYKSTRGRKVSEQFRFRHRLSQGSKRKKNNFKL